VIFNGPDPGSNDEEARKNLTLFFPTRWVPADDDSSKEDYPAMAQETNVDKSRRDELIALIRERNDFSVDETRLQFDSIEYKHPYHDPLVRVSARPPFRVSRADSASSEPVRVHNLRRSVFLFFRPSIHILPVPLSPMIPLFLSRVERKL
jgi:hypothetical protein